MKKISNAAGRWICVILVLVMTAITCVEPVKAVTGYSSTAWVDNLDFVDIRGSEKPIQCIYTMEKDGSFLASSYGFRNEGVKTGETIYIRDWTYTCNGYTYFAVIYKGRLMYLNKKYINVSNLVSVNQPKYPGRKNKVKMKAVAGNISDQNNWFYVYSQGRGERVCDMGTGTGVLPLLLSARAEGTTFDAFEVQRDVADMAQRSVALNGLQARIRVHHADCREAGRIIGCETVQLVVTNPPYTALGAGLVSPEETRALSRSDSDCPLADWMAACARVLQNGGRLCAVFPAPRFLALCDAMRGAKVEPKRVRFIVSRPENAPKLVLVEGKKRGRPGLHLLPMLVTHTADGGFTEEMRRIYGEL